MSVQICSIGGDQLRLYSVSVFTCNVLSWAHSDGLAPILYTLSCWYWCREIGSSSIDWAQLSRLHMKWRHNQVSETMCCKLKCPETQ
jgi:hypothetical protein